MNVWVWLVESKKSARFSHGFQVWRHTKGGRCVIRVDHGIPKGHPIPQFHGARFQVFEGGAMEPGAGMSGYDWISPKNVRVKGGEEAWIYQILWYL